LEGLLTHGESEDDTYENTGTNACQVSEFVIATDAYLQTATVMLPATVIFFLPELLFLSFCHLETVDWVTVSLNGHRPVINATPTVWKISRFTSEIMNVTEFNIYLITPTSV